MINKKEYIKNPCGILSVPYWKAESMTVPDSVKIIHEKDWNNQYSNYRRFFRVKHDLQNLSKLDFDYDTIAIDCQTIQLVDMINASYLHENIRLTEQDVLEWKNHKTFREELCVYINAECGVMAASEIAEYDEKCKEGMLEWTQVLPEYREKGYGTRIVPVLINRLKELGAEFVTVSGNMDNETDP